MFLETSQNSQEKTCGRVLVSSLCTMLVQNIAKSGVCYMNDTFKSTFTWEAKWTQTGMRFHFGWKSLLGVQSALYLCSHELKQNETQTDMDFISVILDRNEISNQHGILMWTKFTWSEINKRKLVGYCV